MIGDDKEFVKKEPYYSRREAICVEINWEDGEGRERSRVGGKFGGVIENTWPTALEKMQQGDSPVSDRSRWVS